MKRQLSGAVSRQLIASLLAGVVFLAAGLLLAASIAAGILAGALGEEHALFDWQWSYAELVRVLTGGLLTVAGITVLAAEAVARVRARGGNNGRTPEMPHQSGDSPGHRQHD